MVHPQTSQAPYSPDLTRSSASARRFARSRRRLRTEKVISRSPSTGAAPAPASAAVPAAQLMLEQEPRMEAAGLVGPLQSNGNREIYGAPPPEE